MMLLVIVADIMVFVFDWFYPRWLDQYYFRRFYNVFEFPLLSLLLPSVLSLRLCYVLGQLVTVADLLLAVQECVAFVLVHAVAFDHTFLRTGLLDFPRKASHLRDQSKLLRIRQCSLSRSS